MGHEEEIEARTELPSLVCVLCEEGVEDREPFLPALARHRRRLVNIALHVGCLVQLIADETADAIAERIPGVEHRDRKRTGDLDEALAGAVMKFVKGYFHDEEEDDDRPRRRR